MNLPERHTHRLASYQRYPGLSEQVCREIFRVTAVRCSGHTWSDPVDQPYGRLPQER